MEKGEVTLKFCDEVRLGEVIEIGGVLYEIVSKYEKGNFVLFSLSLITVLLEQQNKPPNSARVRLPRRLLIKTTR